jgi:hypothetical protein
MKLADPEVSNEELLRRELQAKIEEELRERLGKEKRFKTMMSKHEKDD